MLFRFRAVAIDESGRLNIRKVGRNVDHAVGVSLDHQELARGVELGAEEPALLLQGLVIFERSSFGEIRSNCPRRLNAHVSELDEN